MAGMFYSIEETAEKLGVTQEDVKQLARDGKLREFRDGENIMFKAEEVDRLHDQEGTLSLDVLDETGAPLPEAPAADTTPEAEVPTEETVTPEPALPEEPFALSEESTDTAEASLDDLDSLLAISEDEDVEAETETPAAATEAEPEIDLEIPGLEPEAVTAPTETGGESEPALDLGLAEDDDLALTEEEPQIDLLSDTQLLPETPATETSGPDEVSVGDASTALAGLNEDTAVEGEGMNVLSETDGDYKLTDDTMAETLAGLGATGEASLEEIEEDVSLDSFGSGSGLLDLSLQADDTSLGGILDEIYTNDEDGAAPDTEQATAEGMTAEMEDLPAADAYAEEPEAAMIPLRRGAAVAEIEPDASSNTLGALLFVPLFLAIYTALVAVYATVTSGQLVAAADAVKAYIWMVLGGLFVVALVWAIVGFSKGRAPTGPKSSKKTRGAKAKKEKKQKAPKEKKAKKGLFAKKK